MKIDFAKWIAVAWWGFMTYINFNAALFDTSVWQFSYLIGGAFSLWLALRPFYDRDKGE